MLNTNKIQKNGNCTLFLSVYYVIPYIISYTMHFQHRFMKYIKTAGYIDSNEVQAFTLPTVEAMVGCDLHRYCPQACVYFAVKLHMMWQNWCLLVLACSLGWIISSLPEKNGHHFTDNICKCIFINEKLYILIQISRKLVPKSPIGNKPVLVQVVAWCGTGNKPLPEPMLTQFADA